ncbi:hypothetical protein OG866_00140 [Streptomyces sp. NBC_00663]|uniref:hypothetical protein n=1 Tax=Streptomyces sp. NBC_00663 TaxID=2975801 RepID=UPI002E32CA89|nr:hypothetical protein [Streptomyces sp. NBC_00663]
MKTPAVLRETLRRKAVAHLFAPGGLPRDRATAPSAATPAPWIYGQVIVLLLITCFRPLVLAILNVGEMHGVQWAARDVRWVAPVQFAVGAVVFFWLTWLVIARTPLDQASQRRRLAHRGAAVACGAAAMYAAVPVSHALQRQVALTGFSCTVAWLALEICRAHGVSPATKVPATASERLGDWKIADATFLACMAGGGLTTILLTVLRWGDIQGLPVMKGSQLSAVGVTDFSFVSLGLGVVVAVVIEDVVIVAATTALLTAIRRPAWEIYSLICLVEIMLHAYFGLPALGMALYAVGRVWLYRRYQRLLPLVAGHAAFDLLGGCIQLAPILYRPVLIIPFGLTVIWTDRRLTRAAHPAGQKPVLAEAGLPTTGIPHTRSPVN